MPLALVEAPNYLHGPSTYGLGSRYALTASDGSTLVLWADYLSDGTMKMKLSKLSGDGKGTRTLLETFDPPDSDAKGGFTAALFPDDSVAVLAKSEDRVNLRYCKIRSSDWEAQAWEVVNNHSGTNRAESMDIDVSDANKVFVCWNQSADDSVHSRLKMRDGSGTWVAIRDVAITDGVQRKSCDAASIVALGINGSERNVVFAHGAGKPGVDSGVLLFTCGIDESDGSITDAVTLRGTYMATEADAANTGNATQRNVKLFRGADNEFLLAVMHRAVNKKIGILKAEYNNAVWTILEQLQTSNLQYTIVANQMAITCRHATSAAEEHTVNFYTRGTIEPNKETAFDTIAKIDDTGVTFSGPFKYGIPPTNQMTTYTGQGIGGGGNRNLHLGRHEILIQLNGTLAYGGGTLPANYLYLGYGKLSPINSTSITATVPAHEAVADSSNPPLAVTVDDGQKYAQARQKVHWQFATDAAFQSGDIVISYVQPDSKFKKVEGTDATGVTVTFDDVLPAEYALTGGTYYMRARMVDEWGNSGVWTSTRTVHVIHPPVATPISPTGGAFLNYGDGSVTFNWDITDPSPTDYQTAYQIQVYTNAGAVVFDTGKVISAENSHTQVIVSDHKNTLLNWLVKAWDTNDTSGAFSDPAFFTLTDPPTAVINSPANGSTVETGMPDLVTTVSTSGGRKIKQVIFAITKAGQPIWSTKKVGTWDNGASIAVQVPQNFLDNNTNYSVQVTILDSGNLAGASPIHTFTVAWAPPAAPTELVADAAPYGFEVFEGDPGGYVDVLWDDAEDDDFYSWNLYRKDDLINPSTLAVIEEGEFHLIYKEYVVGSTYQFKDYFAPSGYKVTYMMRQQIDLNGQQVESLDGPLVTVYPKSDGYWLILDSNDDTDAELFKFNVNDDSFTDEQEEAEYIVVGKGRVINRGQDLGPKGTMTSKIRDTVDYTARQKRLMLLEAQKTRRKVWLRNPFGDVFRVSVSQMSVSRIAGVGLAEFVDVSIPYTKVG